MELEHLINDDFNPNGQLDTINAYFLELSRPKCLHPMAEESEINQHKIGFERQCAVMQKHTSKDVKWMNLVEFFTLFEMVSDMNKSS